MKKINYFTFLLALLIVTFSSCAMRDELNGAKGGVDGADSGTMSLSIGTDKVIQVSASTSRADDAKHSFKPEDLDVDSYEIKITNTETKDEVKKCTYKQLKDEGDDLKLPVGKYIIEAYNYDGSKSKASEKPYFYGATSFNILAGKATKVTTKCRMKTIGVVLQLSPEFQNIFADDYEVTITNGDGAFVLYQKNTLDKVHYLAVPQTATSSLNLIFSGKTKKGDDVAYQTAIERPSDAEGNNKLVENEVFIIKLMPETAELGKIKWGITVDLIMNDKQIEFEVPVPDDGEEPVEPVDPDAIKVVGLDRTVVISKNDSDNAPTVDVEFIVPRGIDNLYVTIESEDEIFLGMLEDLFLREKFDIANPTEEQKIALGPTEDEGIGMIDPNDPIKGKTEYVFQLTTFMKLLTLFEPALHTFNIEVYDGTETVKGALKVQVVE